MRPNINTCSPSSSRWGLCIDCVRGHMYWPPSVQRLYHLFLPFLCPSFSFFLCLSLSPPFLPPYLLNPSHFSHSRCLDHVHRSGNPFFIGACPSSRSIRRGHPRAVLWAPSNSPFNFGKVTDRIPDCSWNHFIGLRCMEDTFQLEAQESSHRSRAPLGRV